MELAVKVWRRLHAVRWVGGGRLGGQLGHLLQIIDGRRLSRVCGERASRLLSQLDHSRHGHLPVAVADTPIEAVPLAAQAFRAGVGRAASRPLVPHLEAVVTALGLVV